MITTSAKGRSVSRNLIAWSLLKNEEAYSFSNGMIEHLRVRYNPIHCLSSSRIFQQEHFWLPSSFQPARIYLQHWLVLCHILWHLHCLDSIICFRTIWNDSDHMPSTILAVSPVVLRPRPPVHLVMFTTVPQLARMGAVALRIWLCARTSVPLTLKNKSASSFDSRKFSIFCKWLLGGK